VPTCCAGSGANSEAASAYRSAIEGCGNAREREFLEARLRELEARKG
jgi:predicted RNA polymerase sigma factor